MAATLCILVLMVVAASCLYEAIHVHGRQTEKAPSLAARPRKGSCHEP